MLAFQEGKLDAVKWDGVVIEWSGTTFRWRLSSGVNVTFLSVIFRYRILYINFNVKWNEESVC